MKKLLLICALAFAQLMLAKTITVSNIPGLQTTMFVDLQEAITAASSGDIILIKGSSDSYGNITIDKRLTFVGEGFITSLNATKTQIGTISFTSVNGNGTTFKSVHIGTVSGSSKIDLLTFDNVFSSSGSNETFGEGWTFLQCSFTLKVLYPCLVYNCLLNRIETNSKVTGGTIIRNSIIKQFYFNPELIQFEDCIITDANGGTSDVPDNCTFTRSIFTHATFTQDTLLQNLNIVDQCQFNTDVDFVNTIHYQLGELSVAKGAGTNGTDIEVTGGTYPAKEFFGENSLPKVYNNVVETSVITPGAPLKLRFSARRKAK